jgi:hypothetical protein
MLRRRTAFGRETTAGRRPAGRSEPACRSEPECRSEICIGMARCVLAPQGCREMGPHWFASKSVFTGTACICSSIRAVPLIRIQISLGCVTTTPKSALARTYQGDTGQANPNPIVRARNAFFDARRGRVLRRGETSIGSGGNLGWGAVSTRICDGQRIGERGDDPPADTLPVLSVRARRRQFAPGAGRLAEKPGRRRNALGPRPGCQPSPDTGRASTTSFGDAELSRSREALASRMMRPPFTQ